MKKGRVIRRLAKKIPIIKVLNVHHNFILDELSWDFEPFKAILVDSHIPGKYGGTKVVHDWKVSRRIRDLIYPKPLMLAGGLNSENIYETILAVKPFAVNVSSGVESKPGVKDRQKIALFINEVREEQRGFYYPNSPKSKLLSKHIS